MAGASLAVSPPSGRPVILDHVDHSNVLNPILLEKGIRSLVGVPLLVHGAVIGVLHVGTVQQPVQQADGGGVLGQEPAPRLEGPVAGDAQGAAFIGGRHHAEQQLRAGVIQQGEPDPVDQDEVVAEPGCR